MNKITLLAGIAIGAVLTAGVAQLQAQAPAAANTTRPAVFVITLQNITDQAKYDKDYAPGCDQDHQRQRWSLHRAWR